MTGSSKKSARLTVERRQSDSSVVASEVCASYPLRLHLMPNKQSYANKKDQVSKTLCCFLIGYGGGLVSGDDVALNVCVKQNASLVVTSQSTSKAFRARNHQEAQFHTNAQIQSGGLLVWAPQPTQLFRDSRFKQSTNVIMQGNDASVLLLDWYTGGRKNLDGGGFQMKSFETITTVSYESDGGKPVKPFFRDASILSGGPGLQRHMRDFAVVAMAVLIGPKVQEVADRLLQQYSSRNSYSRHHRDEGGQAGLNNDGMIISCGSFPTAEGQPNGVLLRVVSQTLEQAALFLSEHVGTLNGQLEDDPFMEILVSRCGHSTLASNSRPAGYGDKAGRKLSVNMISQSLPMGSADTKHLDTDIGPTKSPANAPTAVRPSMIYQLVDASAPTGSFAHSNTLEAAFQLQLVDASNLLDYTFDVLLQTLTSQVPFLMRACSLFQILGASEFSSNPATDQVRSLAEQWNELDRQLSTNTTSQVANRASCLQGSGTLRAFAQTFPDISAILGLIKKTALRNSGGHAATSFGVVCGLLGIEPALCASMYCYTTARDMINAAVRMNILGPLEGGCLINEVCRNVDDILDKHIATSIVDGETRWIAPEAAHQTAPLVEVLANAHDRLYTRLFNS